MTLIKRWVWSPRWLFYLLCVIRNEICWITPVLISAHPDEKQLAIKGEIGTFLVNIVLAFGIAMHLYAPHGNPFIGIGAVVLACFLTNGQMKLGQKLFEMKHGCSMDWERDSCYPCD